MFWSHGHVILNMKDFLWLYCTDFLCLYCKNVLQIKLIFCSLT